MSTTPMYPVSPADKDDSERESEHQHLARLHAAVSYNDAFLLAHYRRAALGILENGDLYSIANLARFAMARAEKEIFYMGFEPFVLYQLQHHFEQIEGWIHREKEGLENEYTELMAAQIRLIKEAIEHKERGQ